MDVDVEADNDDVAEAVADDDDGWLQLLQR